MYYYNSQKNKGGYKPLEYYGIIGNLETCALVGVDGSIDWMCLPHLESPSLFGELLDGAKGGSWSLRPSENFKSRQSYAGNTNILQTKFLTARSASVITDFMPPFKKRKIWHKHQILFRHVKCLRGNQAFLLNFQPRFNYGREKCEMNPTDSGILAQSTQNTQNNREKIYLDGPTPFEIKDQGAKTQFSLKSGQEIFFTLQYNNHDTFSFKDCLKQFKITRQFWEKWAHKCQKKTCVFRGPWHDLAVRSGLVLKLLTHGETGSIAAAATTSLPESIGGVRNWDYRFNWIRDSVFTAQALYNLGHHKESRELFNWYKRLYRGAKFQDIKIMHGLHGENRLPEIILKHWSGYKNSRPVKVGNKAVTQRQLDVYGELLNMAYETNRFGEGLSKNDWKLLKKIVTNIKYVWNKKDAGLWEMRGGYQHFVYSKVMCWVAVDRGIKIAEKKGFPAPLQQWKTLRDLIRKTILEKGYNEEIKSFVQAFGSKQLDASSLLIPLVGFLAIGDSRVQDTIKATLKHLTKNGLVYRYRSYDGLPGHEGAFILCTFWLIDVLSLSGKVKQAEKIYTSAIKFASPLGLLAEEVNAKTGLQMGNFPQAFSHIGLINSALYLGLAKGFYKKQVKPVRPVSDELIRHKYSSVFELLNNK